MTPTSPIRSVQAYKTALDRASELMKLSNDDALDELEVLQAVIERWERSQGAHPTPSLIPVDAIRFRMAQLGLKPRDLEAYIGSRARVSEVLSGTRQLSIEMIRALNLHLGIPAASLIGASPKASAPQRALPSKAAIEKLQSWRKFPANETVPAFIARVSGTVPQAAFLRKTRTDRANSKSDPMALAAWCAMVIELSADLKLPKKASGPSDDHAKKLAALSLLSDGPSRVLEFLRRSGIIFVTLEHLPGTYLDGAALRRPSDGALIIAMTLRYDRLDNFWFTLLHEYCHISRHLNTDNPVIMDDMDIRASDDIEEEADRFAQDTLIAQALWRDRATSDFSTDALMKLADDAGVHPAVVAGRWQREYRDFRKFSKLLGRGVVRQQLLSLS